MAATGSLLSPGTQVSEGVDGHTARSGVRRLVAALFDAWDDGDARGLTALFAPAGRWTDPSGSTVTGSPTAIGLAYGAWRRWEPWCIHWLSNEQITAVGPGRCRGSWLWSAASTIERGETAAWSGGDLLVDAVWCEGGWRIESISVTDRYRSPYDRGWLAEPMVPVPFLHGHAREEVWAPVEPSDAGPAEATLEDLLSEVELRSLMGEFVNDLEEDRPPSEVSSHWAADGILVLEDRSGGTAQGVEAIAALIGRERAELTAFMRMLFSESIQVAGRRASCRWRDLWTGLRNGRAVWISHRYDVGAVRGPDGWRFERMERRRVLDCAYDEGWLPGPNGSAETARP